MFGRKKQESIHHVKVEVLEPEDDLLQRTALLHASLVKAVAGTKLLEHVKSDLRNGCIEVIVEGDTICPAIEFGTVRVQVKPAGEAFAAFHDAT